MFKVTIESTDEFSVQFQDDELHYAIAECLLMCERNVEGTLFELIAELITDIDHSTYCDAFEGVFDEAKTLPEIARSLVDKIKKFRERN